jgi:pimeloyl-ACP methyl ester carboxylesterase
MLRLRPHVRRLIALDMPGHGFSETPTSLITPFVLVDAVAEAIAHFGSEPSIVVGNSLGGGVALQLAVDDPSRIAALALLSPAGARIPRSDWDELVARFQVDSKSAAQELMGSIMHRAPWYLSAFTRDFQAALQSRAVQDVLKHSTLEDSFEPHQLRNLPMPIFLMWGQSERILPHSAFEFFRKHLPHHTQIERPHGFGHCPHLDDPDRLAVRLLDFMRHALRNRRSDAGHPVLRPATARDWRERRTA